MTSEPLSLPHQKLFEKGFQFQDFAEKLSSFPSSSFPTAVDPPVGVSSTLHDLAVQKLEDKRKRDPATLSNHEKLVMGCYTGDISTYGDYTDPRHVSAYRKSSSAPPEVDLSPLEAAIAGNNSAGVVAICNNISKFPVHFSSKLASIHFSSRLAMELHYTAKNLYSLDAFSALHSVTTDWRGKPGPLFHSTCTVLANFKREDLLREYLRANGPKCKEMVSKWRRGPENSALGFIVHTTRARWAPGLRLYWEIMWPIIVSLPVLERYAFLADLISCIDGCFLQKGTAHWEFLALHSTELRDLCMDHSSDLGGFLLFSSCSRDSFDAVDFVLNRLGANPNYLDSPDTKCPYSAAAHDRNLIEDQLEDSLQGYFTHRFWSCTPLTVACHYSRPDVVGLLLRSPIIRPELVSIPWWTPAFAAAYNYQIRWAIGSITDDLLWKKMFMHSHEDSVLAHYLTSFPPEYSALHHQTLKLIVGSHKVPALPFADQSPLYRKVAAQVANEDAFGLSLLHADGYIVLKRPNGGDAFNGARKRACRYFGIVERLHLDLKYRVWSAGFGEERISFPKPELDMVLRRILESLEHKKEMGNKRQRTN